VLCKARLRWSSDRCGQLSQRLPAPSVAVATMHGSVAHVACCSFITAVERKMPGKVIMMVRSAGPARVAAIQVPLL
jgi:hypothetical protein